MDMMRTVAGGGSLPGIKVTAEDASAWPGWHRLRGVLRRAYPAIPVPVPGAPRRPRPGAVHGRRSGKSLAGRCERHGGHRHGGITATFGGLLRDLLGGDSPGILSREIYASAAAAGAAAFVAMTLLGAPCELALVTGFLIALLVRAASLRFGWTIPRYRPRAGIPSHTLSD